MPTARRLAVLSELCTVVSEATHLSSRTALAATRWFAECGRDLPAPIAANAAWVALVALDIDTASRLATPVARQHWRGAYVLGEIARWQNDIVTADRWLAQAGSLAPDDDSIRRVAMTRSALEAWQNQDPQAAIDVLREAAGNVSTPMLTDLLLCEAAFLATLLGQFDQAVVTARELLAHDDVDPMTACTAGINLGYSQVMLADTDGLDESIRRIETAFDIVRQEHPEGPDLVCALSVGERLLSGNIASAVTTAERELTELRRTGSPRGICAALASQPLLYAADPRAADVAFEGVQQLRRHDPYNALSFALGHAVLATALLGDTNRARELLAEAENHEPDARSIAILGRARAAILATTDPDAAAEVLIGSGTDAVAANHISLGACALFEAFSYAPAASVAPFVIEACTGRSAPLLTRFSRVAHGVTAARVDDVLDVATEFETDGAPYLAAIALISAANADDDPERARRAAARATAHIHRAGWLPTPVFNCEEALSMREIEIALAAAEGQSDREIADAAFLSPRTVGNHLYRVYTKLGVEGRDELAPLLGAD